MSVGLKQSKYNCLIFLRLNDLLSTMDELVVYGYDIYIEPMLKRKSVLL